MFSIKQADMTKQQQQKTSFGLNDYATNMRFRLVITQLGNWSIYFRTTYSALHLLYIYIQRNTPWRMKCTYVVYHVTLNSAPYT